MIPQREIVREKYKEICENFDVPKSLFDHQADTISLLLSKQNVLCGLPTGSGKTLAQLVTVLFTKGTALVIPPLLTIEKQMCDICEAWRISFLNLSTFSNPREIQTEIESNSPQIIIASIEQISDLGIQKALINIKLDYVAIDEAQVGKTQKHGHNFPKLSPQVLDPQTGWVQIRPYNQETWSFIRARFRCPVLLMSATMEEKSLQRISGRIVCIFFKFGIKENICRKS